MKYIAVFEIPDDKVGLLELTLPTSDGLTVTSPIEFKKAPKPLDKVGIYEKHSFDWHQDCSDGYNQALKDCGVIDDDSN